MKEWISLIIIIIIGIIGVLSSIIMRRYNEYK